MTPSSNHQVKIEDLITQTRGQLQADILRAIHGSSNEISSQIEALATKIPTTLRAKESSTLGNWRHIHEADISQVERQLTEAIESDDREQASQMILDSLFYEQLHDRHDAVALAHRRTFRWIFDVQHVETGSWTNFQAWLSNTQSDNFYWITGRPGSGKSTLMRFIADDPQTTSCLQQWAGNDQFVVASCFFWMSGDYMQKSYEGLLRTLLFQLLSRNRHMVGDIFPWRWRSYLAGAFKLGPWTNQQLLNAFESTIEALSNQSKVCLFIDGLDEYEGDDEARSTMLDLIKSQALKPQVKVCASSRPWVIFQDAFEGRPSLQLHLFTRPDIASFVDDKLVATCQFQKMQSKDPIACQRLHDEIVEKANGVFLWVRLVIRELLQCLRNRDGIEGLHRRLTSMPSDLKAFLERMFNQLDDFYIEEAVDLFRVALAAWEQFTLLRYSLVLRARNVDPASIAVGCRSKTEILSMCEDTERQLNSRCQGLLEVTTSSSDKPLRKVDFLHRSVRDFLLNVFLDQLQDRLSAGTQGNEPFDPENLIAGAMLAQMKMLWFDPGYQDIAISTADFMRAVRRYEQRTQQPLTHIMDELHRVGGTLNDRAPTSKVIDPSKVDSKFRIPQQEASFLCFSMAWGLDRYFESKIQQDTSISFKKPGCPLLLFVLWSEKIDPQRLAPLVQLLLDRGADPNEYWNKCTVWGHFLRTIREDPEPSRVEIVKCFRAMIDHGAYKVGSAFSFPAVCQSIERRYGKQIAREIMKAARKSRSQRLIIRFKKTFMTKKPQGSV